MSANFYASLGLRSYDPELQEQLDFAIEKGDEKSRTIEAVCLVFDPDGDVAQETDLTQEEAERIRRESFPQGTIFNYDLEKELRDELGLFERLFHLYTLKPGDSISQFNIEMENV